MVQSMTIRNIPWSYLHLDLISTATLLSTPTAQPIDLLTARKHLTSALQQFLGMTGTAIPIDFLKIQGRGVWIRVPKDDGAIFVSALAGWVGLDGIAWRIRGKSEWLGAIAAGDGRELFEG